jgi:hypothetical protein
VYKVSGGLMTGLVSTSVIVFWLMAARWWFR